LDNNKNEYCFNKHINFIPKIRENITIKAALREAEDIHCPKRRDCDKKSKQYLSKWGNNY
jgi:hypothetical protein